VCQPTDGTLRLFGQPINTLELQNLVVYLEQESKVRCSPSYATLTAHGHRLSL
jgi:hypothetical protein